MSRCPDAAGGSANGVSAAIPRKRYPPHAVLSGLFHNFVRDMFCRRWDCRTALPVRLPLRTARKGRPTTPLRTCETDHLAAALAPRMCRTWHSNEQSLRQRTGLHRRALPALRIAGNRGLSGDTPRALVSRRAQAPDGERVFLFPTAV